MRNSSRFTCLVAFSHYSSYHIGTISSATSYVSTCTITTIFCLTLWSSFTENKMALLHRMCQIKVFSKMCWCLPGSPQGIQEAPGCLIEVGGDTLIIWIILGESSPTEMAQKEIVKTTGKALPGHAVTSAECLNKPRAHVMNVFLDKCLNKDFVLHSLHGSEAEMICQPKIIGQLNHLCHFSSQITAHCGFCSLNERICCSSLFGIIINRKIFGFGLLVRQNKHSKGFKLG